MKSPRRSTVAVVFATAVIASAVGIANAATQAIVVGSPSIVTVRETDFKIGLGRRVVKAGKVTFVVADHGKAPHELVVLRTAVDASKLSRTADSTRAVEVGRIGESGDLKPGTNRSFAVTLKPGHYALICNITGHYAAGMFANFTVTG